MPESSRLDDLRRRVQQDPASIAFAQLAEELRRADVLQEAVDVSRQGLARHPNYLSARVTLGRALLQLHELDLARVELERVLVDAPENLAAVRGLAEICRRTDDLRGAAGYYKRAMALAPNDPEIDRALSAIQPRLAAEDVAAADRAARTLAALEQFLTAIHVACAEP